MRTAVAIAIAVAAAASTARAHVAPSMDDNNRYLKLTPLGDRVRLAYTVYFGEIPGAAARRTIDANHDGAISDAEAQAFGEQLAVQVKAGLTITVDGTAAPVAWNEVDVGMQVQTTAAGSFSVDLIAWLCLPTIGGAHTVGLVDRTALPRPGESELRVEDTPGVRVDTARLGGVDLVDLDARWQGAGGALAQDGFALAFTASDRAPVLKDGACAAAAPSVRASGTRAGLWIGLGAAGALGLGAAIALGVRRQRRRGPGGVRVSGR